VDQADYPPASLETCGTCLYLRWRPDDDAAALGPARGSLLPVGRSRDSDPLGISGRGADHARIALPAGRGSDSRLHENLTERQSTDAHGKDLLEAASTIRITLLLLLLRSLRDRDRPPRITGGSSRYLRRGTASLLRKAIPTPRNTPTLGLAIGSARQSPRGTARGRFGPGASR